MMDKLTWWEYAIFDDGGLCGILEDAPDEEKKKYKKYIEEIELIRRKGKPIPK